MDFNTQTLVLGVSALLFAIAVLALLIWVFKAFFGGAGIGPARKSPERRLGVIETATIDPKRKLYLIRRDDVEHLVIIGGPVDLVVETSIPRPHLSPKLGGVYIAKNEASPVLDYGQP